MSESESFIQEVSEEVRRDRLFALMRRYGWIAVLLVLLLVGGAGYREYAKAQAQNRAEAFGDAILSALEAPEPAGRIDALTAIQTGDAGARAVLDLLVASEVAASGEDAQAVSRLQAVADDTQVPGIYRQVALYKAMTRADGVLDAEARRAGLLTLVAPGQPLRVLAEEQLALIDIETGDREAALERLDRIRQDSEASQGLRRRASQLIVSLGGTVDEG